MGENKHIPDKVVTSLEENNGQQLSGQNWAFYQADPRIALQNHTANVNVSEEWSSTYVLRQGTRLLPIPLVHCLLSQKWNILWQSQHQLPLLTIESHDILNWVIRESFQNAVGPFSDYFII